MTSIERNPDDKILEALFTFNGHREFNEIRSLYKTYFKEIKKKVVINGYENAMEYVYTLDESKRHLVKQHHEMLKQINRGIFINMVTDVELI